MTQEQFREYQNRLITFEELAKMTDEEIRALPRYGKSSPSLVIRMLLNKIQYMLSGVQEIIDMTEPNK